MLTHLQLSLCQFMLQLIITNHIHMHLSCQLMAWLMLLPQNLTHAKSGIFKPKTKAYFASHHPIPSTMTAFVEFDAEPTCFTQASQSPKWRQDILDEFNAFLKQGTWTLIPHVTYANTVGCKWVFKIKRHSDGSLKRYKARIVTKGFHQ